MESQDRGAEAIKISCIRLGESTVKNWNLNFPYLGTVLTHRFRSFLYLVIIRQPKSATISCFTEASCILSVSTYLSMISNEKKA